MSNAAERAYQMIRMRIMDGRFAPGEKLREEMLAAEIGVSRTPVRDALRRLLADGLVESTHNHGTSVTEIARDELLEVFELRALLEGHAARKAAERITAAEVAALEKLADAMEGIEGTEAERMAEFDRINHEFHLIIIRATRSRQMEAALARVIQVPLVFLKRFRLHRPVDIARSNRQHREIIEALHSHNPDWAAMAMSAHLLSTRPTAAALSREKQDHDADAEPEAVMGMPRMA